MVLLAVVSLGSWTACAPDAESKDSGEEGADTDGGTTDSETPTECPEGFSGEDCTFCTWESAGTACHPGQTADVFDLDAIRAMTLDDLRWEQTSLTETESGTLIVGELVTAFAGVTADGVDQDVDMRSQVAIYLPSSWPLDTPDAALGKAYVGAAHTADKVYDETAAAIAVATGMPVLYHGEYSENWEQLGFTARSEINGASGSAVSAHNMCEPVDWERGNYQLFLANVDLRVITLAQRLAEDYGTTLDQFALRGFSKEGGGAWLALATDDRIVVGAAGGYPAQDRIAYCENVVETLGCATDTVSDNSGEGCMRALEWYKTTPAGAAFLNRFDISLNRGHMVPRIVLLDGDTYAADMHDGQHAIPGAEDEFLDVFTETPWRYVRKGESYEGSSGEDGDTVSTTVVPYLLAEMLYREDDPAEWYPKVQVAEGEIVDGILSVYAEVDGEVEGVSLVGSASEDRVWNDEGQMGWFALEMTPSGAGWTVDVDLTALGVQDMVIGYYVEAHNTLSAGDKDYSRTDASPIRYLQLTDALTCDIEPTDYCPDA